jgi:hypothetical protein
MSGFFDNIRKFWTRKRVVKLLVFAFLTGNLTYYCVASISRRQIFGNSAAHHGKIYAAYLQAVERARQVNTPQPNLQEQPVSPYWKALRDVRSQFPFYRLNVVIKEAVQDEHEKNIISILKNRPKGWTATDEKDGWVRSYFALPTKNAAAFQVSSYVKEDLSSWEGAAVLIGAYAFALLFVFGWFWTRALDENTLSGEVRSKMSQIDAVLGEVGQALNHLKHEKKKEGPASKSFRDEETLRTLDELLAQVKLLAVNGSVEAARSTESYRVFHVLMQEIGQLATRARELVKEPGPSSSASVSRRVG